MFGLAAPRIPHNVAPPRPGPRASLEPFGALGLPGGAWRTRGPRFALCFALSPPKPRKRQKNNKNKLLMQPILWG